MDLWVWAPVSGAIPMSQVPPSSQTEKRRRLLAVTDFL